MTLLCAALWIAQTSAATPPASLSPEQVRLRQSVINAPGAQSAGRAYQVFFGTLTIDQLRALKNDPDDGIALQAAWELARKPVKIPRVNYGPSYVYAAKPMAEFLRFLTQRTGFTPPDWWGNGFTHLAVNWKGNHYQWPFLKAPEPTDLVGTAPLDVGKLYANGGTIPFRGVEYEFPSRAKSLAFAANGLGYLFSGDDVFLAPYQTGGGFAYEISRYTKGGKLLWVEPVWSAGQTVLDGMAFQYASLGSQGDEVAAYSGGDTGQDMEAFHVSDGKPVFRFCSGYWFNFSEGWKVPWGK